MALKHRNVKQNKHFTITIIIFFDLAHTSIQSDNVV